MMSQPECFDAERMAYANVVQVRCFRGTGPACPHTGDAGSDGLDECVTEITIRLARQGICSLSCSGVHDICGQNVLRKMGCSSLPLSGHLSDAMGI